ncbi:membrane protein [Nocardiopsis sp. NRRL B-16309]|nr:membrane protein [Nocardiopsis sp. NRRL B-16309]
MILLSAVPALAGTVRLGEIAGGATPTPENTRFLTDPVPLVLHIVSATVFCVVGAFQFSPGLRRRHLGWHRASGRIMLPLGIVSALTGLWMTFAYDVPAPDGVVVYAQRILFGSAMAVALVLAYVEVRRSDIARHRAWVIRGYAIGQGAGTQVFTHLPLMLLGGEFTETTRALAMGAGWVVNIVVAEWIIRRRPRRGPARPTPAAAGPEPSATSRAL